MTDEELKRLREMCERPTMETLVSDACDMLPEELQPRALLSEIGRLRALVKSAECVDGVLSGGSCTWCGAFRQGPLRPHAPDCPAFTPDGEVR